MDVEPELVSDNLIILAEPVFEAALPDQREKHFGMAPAEDLPADL